MSTINQQPKNFIKLLQVIHLVLVASVLLFTSYVFFKDKDVLFFSYEDNRPFLFLAIIIAFGGNLVSKYLYANLLNKITISTDFMLKTIKFSTAHFYRLALLEFPAFLCIFFTMQFNNSFYFILVGILVLMMLAIYPTKNKFKNDVALTNEEKSMLEKL